MVVERSLRGKWLGHTSVSLAPQGHDSMSLNYPDPTYAPSADDDLCAAWESFFGPSTRSLAAFDQILEAYRFGRRFYHTIEHGLEVADTAAALAAVDAPDHVEPIVLAAWCHDAVYGSADDVTASASVAARSAAALGWSTAGQDYVEQLVLATTHTREGLSFEQQLLCDADLAVLAKPWPRYLGDVANIRAELATHNRHGESWPVRRRRMLGFFRAKPAIFHTDRALDRWEVVARGNIEREARNLV
jgi:predicted metal-dependent HD superfamily phosphohydrolase